MPPISILKWIVLQELLLNALLSVKTTPMRKKKTQINNSASNCPLSRGEKNAFDASSNEVKTSREKNATDFSWNTREGKKRNYNKINKKIKSPHFSGFVYLKKVIP